MTTDQIALLNVMAATIVGAAVVVATFSGPILAARGADRRRAVADKRAAKMRVFRELMGFRYDVRHSSFVGALNLVPVEFHDNEGVLKAFRDYLAAFHRDMNDRSDCAEIRQKATVRLITAVGSDLGYQLEQLDVMDEVYSPQLWADIMEEQRQVRQLFVDIAAGKKFLPIINIIPDLFIEELGEGKAAIRNVQVPFEPSSAVRPK